MDYNIDLLEQGEWRFCSLWTKSITFSDGARILHNPKLGDDYFFNRSSIDNCMNQNEALGRLEKYCHDEKLGCNLYVMSSQDDMQRLNLLDEMHVLVSDDLNRIPNGQDDIEYVNCWSEPQFTVAWTEVFCKSFDVLDWQLEVEQIIQQEQFRIVDLVIGLLNKKPATCAAVYRFGEYHGVYCLGVLPELRGRGLSIATLRWLQREYCNIYLQALGRENSLSLYRKCGFGIAYSKKIYSLEQCKYPDNN